MQMWKRFRLKIPREKNKEVSMQSCICFLMGGALLSISEVVINSTVSDHFVVATLTSKCVSVHVLQEHTCECYFLSYFCLNLKSARKRCLTALTRAIPQKCL